MSTPKTVLGGDDVHAIVVDCGSWAMRIGSAGDDSPRSIIPPAVGLKPSSDTAADVVMSDAADSFVKASSSSKKLISSYVAGDSLMSAPHLLHDIQPIYQYDSSTGDARVVNWDGMHAAWRAGLQSLHIDPSTHPFMLVEPSRMWNDSERSAALQLAFEGLQVPSAYIGRGAAMAAFSAARSTACVLDIGAQGVTAVPVIDGYAMQRTMKRSAMGGIGLTEKLSKWAEECLSEKPDYDGKERLKKTRSSDEEGEGEQKQEDRRERTFLRAHHELKRERIVIPDADPNDVRKFVVTDLSESQTGQFTPTHREFYRLRVIDDLKASLLRVNLSGKESDNESSKADGASAKKPSTNDSATNSNNDKEEKEGSSNSNAKDKDKQKDISSAGKSDFASSQPSAKYALPDGNELCLDDHNGLEISEALFSNQPDNNLHSLTDLVLESIGSSDVDNRRDLFGGVVVVGGSSLLPGCIERLSKELALKIPQAYKLKLHSAVNTTERTCAGWIGGSIVASLGTFQQAWISKEEYNELGADRALRKCP